MCWYFIVYALHAAASRVADQDVQPSETACKVFHSITNRCLRYSCILHSGKRERYALWRKPVSCTL
jgi:hypothetical protein